jgi:hypothetical protein
MTATLQTSGPISLGNIAAVFGGSQPYSAANYYAGGPYVPSGTSGTDGAVPTSGAISWNQFYGTASYPPLVASYSGNTSTTDGVTPFWSSLIDCNASGGSGTGYSYSWEFVSGTDFPTNFGNSYQQQWEWTSTTGGSASGVYQCIVSDSVGHQTNAGQITISLFYNKANCCSVDAYLVSGKRVGDAIVGDDLVLMEDDGNGHFHYHVTKTRPGTADCGTIVTKSGIKLTLSYSTPIAHRKHINAPVEYKNLEEGIIGYYVPVLDYGKFRWERVIDVEHKGELPVALLSCDDGVYAAGDEPGRQIFTHNTKT